MKKITLLGFIIALLFCSKISFAQTTEKHLDKPFIQDFSVKYTLEHQTVILKNAAADHNGYIQILSSKGLLRPRNGQFLFPGTLVTDRQDRPTSDKHISSIATFQDQLVYLDDKAVFSNAWAGKLFVKHALPGANILTVGKDFGFLISDGKVLKLISNSTVAWEGSLAGESVKEIKFDAKSNLYWILGAASIQVFSPDKKQLTKVIDGTTFTCLAPVAGKVFVGTKDGYLELDAKTQKQLGGIHQKMPWTEITSANEVNGELWFGSTYGAMMLRPDGKFNYFASKRWLPSDTIVSITKGPEHSVLVLTNGGMAQILFKSMTLEEKAMYYEKQVRDRHIRLGFNATISGMTNGDVTTGSLENSDNDGLWTTMYLAGETFRYAVTKSDEALQYVRESLDAIERLYTINPLHNGFPSRSFERAGYNKASEPWRATEDPEWDWKSTTSSDEAIGHIFACGAIAELVPDPALKKQAITIIDTLMSHVVTNDFYMIDWNGKPTQWGKWNPDYVNARPKIVGDRKINSSNIIAMLQTAWHFTKKPKYKDAAFLLMKKHGYLENLMQPMKGIGMAPKDADGLSQRLSSEWNHSDDEMYYCGYWGLYRYALNDTLKAKYKEAIIDHWEIERPEKEGLWNIMTAIAGAKKIDLNEAIWYLQRYPLDMINWTVVASHRKDIEKIAPNFRNQTITEVLPPDELPLFRHNENRFNLEGHDNGSSEQSAGDIWLLPYWIGRYLNVIGAPEKAAAVVKK